MNFKNSIRCALVFVAALCCLPRLFASAAPNDKPEAPAKPPEPAIVWKQSVIPGPAVTLRVKRPMGKSMIYQGTMDREQRSGNSYHEVDNFYVNALCSDQEDGRDMLAFLRTFLDRKRTEKYENGKTVERALENSTDLIDLGPNFTIVGQSLRCYAFDRQNRIASKALQLVTLKDGNQLKGNVTRDDDTRITLVTDDDKFDVLKERIAKIENVAQPHVCINEAPHYMFPIFPERAVAPGDAWRFRIPTIIPLEQSIAAKLLPTQFDAIFNARLREVRETPTGKTAVVDYQVTGSFDSSLPEFSNRFADDFLNSTRITHKMVGEGTAIVDVEHGWILERHETFNFVFYGSSKQDPERKFDKKGVLISEKPRKPLENKAEITSKFDLKLLMPGTRLRSGAPVPSYE